MTHKEIIVGKEFPYHGTDVPFERSMAQIMGMLLAARGVVKVAPLYEKAGDVQRVTLMVQEENGTQFLIHFPVTYRRPAKGRQPALDMRISGRLIFYHLKDALAMAEVKYLSFTQAMAPYIALPGPDAVPRPLYDYLPGLDGTVAAKTPILPYLAFELQQLEDRERDLHVQTGVR
ncbi:MAG: hypothetical protein QMD46_12185 [Methanomicrobiales archaeon]|nr:hypothetical protein [Methanomicrobiales archaeon]